MKKIGLKYIVVQFLKKEVRDDIGIVVDLECYRT